MDNLRSTRGQLNDIIRQQNKYSHHYRGRVFNNQDPLNRGRVQAEIQALGWVTGNNNLSWCESRDKHSMSVPSVGEWVDIYFMEGDRDQPIYTGIAAEIKGTSIKNAALYGGNPNFQVVYESPDQNFFIFYNPETQIVSITNSSDINGEVYITLDVSNPTAGITLGTGDSAEWIPNTLAIDPYTGVPHGGPAGGIIKLKGASNPQNLNFNLNRGGI